MFGSLSSSYLQTRTEKKGRHDFLALIVWVIALTLQVYIGNLSFSTTEEQIREQLAPFGGEL